MSKKNTKEEEIIKEETEGVKEELKEETATKDDNDVENKNESVEEPKPNSEEVTETAKDPKDPKDAKIEDLEDRLKRQMAEFDNFRKRTEKEKAQMFDMGAMAILEKILPVIDNFERGLDTADDSPFAEGMKMIYKQIQTSLEEIGLKEIPALGETFDPNMHNAVMHEDNPDAGENEITQVMQKGYTYHETVIRHSMVKVAN